MSPVKSFIFDVDGVIVDSNPVHIQGWREYLRRVGVTAYDSLPERMYGRHNDDIVRDLIGSHLTPEEVEAHGAAKESLYREVMRPQLEAHLVSGLAGFVRRHEGIPMGVASNAEPANVDFILHESGLRSRFAVVVDGHQVSRPKPDPEVYLKAARLLGVCPQECLVFEDSATGLQAAKSAGARVVALRTTHKQFDGADLEVDDFLSPELEPWIRRLLS